MLQRQLPPAELEPQLISQWLEPSHAVPAVLVQATAIASQIEYPAEAVVLRLEEPSAVIEGVGPSGRHDRLDPGRGVRVFAGMGLLNLTGR